MGSKLRKIKGHHVCHLETLLPSLLTHPEKGHAIIYLIPPPIPSFPFSSFPLHAPNHPPTQPASQPAGLWTHCGAWGQYCGQPALCSHGWAESEWGRLARWNQTGVWFRGVSCEGWISYTSQCCFWKQTAAWSCPRKHLHALWLFPIIRQNVFLLFHGELKAVSNSSLPIYALLLY